MVKRERLLLSHLLRTAFWYVSWSLNVTRLMKYAKSSAPPTISESGREAALRTATVHLWVWVSGADSLSCGVRTLAVFP